MVAEPGIVRGQSVADEKLARAKELRREMTPAEKILWARLRQNQLNGLHFRRQQIIDGFLADFYCHAAGIVLELDGLIHLKQVNYDQERDRVIATHNLQNVRISNDEIMSNVDNLLQRIETLCQSRKSKSKK
jgi:very-short-patch-repair endonuclease